MPVEELRGDQPWTDDLLAAAHAEAPAHEEPDRCGLPGRGRAPKTMDSAVASTRRGADAPAHRLHPADADGGVPRPPGLRVLLLALGRK